MSGPSQQLTKLPALRGAQFFRHGIHRLDRLLAAASTYASDENGAIECGVAAVRLGIWHDYGAGRLRPARYPAAGTAEATPDVLIRRPLPHPSSWV